jgi:hypothetical protein
MDLTDEEIRVLGCLVEKERTTPDQYPLTTNALRLACNQKTNREPVVDYDERSVDAAMLRLRERGLARTVKGDGRALKHKHVLGEVWRLDDQELAVLAVLALRGPQTLGELRTRTERMAAFESLTDVSDTLDRLAAQAEPLTARLERRPGHKEDRYAHLLAEEIAWPEAASGDGDGGAAASNAGRSGLAARVEELEEEVQSLRSDLDLLRTQFDKLCDILGEHPD